MNSDISRKASLRQEYPLWLGNDAIVPNRFFPVESVRRKVIVGLLVYMLETCWVRV
jgi:hypothetical protein